MNPASGYWSRHIGSTGTSPRQQKSVSIHLDTIHNPTFSTGSATMSLPYMNKIWHTQEYINNNMYINNNIYIYALYILYICVYLFSIYTQTVPFIGLKIDFEIT